MGDSKEDCGAASLCCLLSEECTGDEVRSLQACRDVCVIQSLVST